MLIISNLNNQFSKYLLKKKLSQAIFHKKRKKKKSKTTETLKKLNVLLKDKIKLRLKLKKIRKMKAIHQVICLVKENSIVHKEIPSLDSLKLSLTLKILMHRLQARKSQSVLVFITQEEKVSSSSSQSDRITQQSKQFQLLMKPFPKVWSTLLAKCQKNLLLRSKQKLLCLSNPSRPAAKKQNFKYWNFGF